MPRRHHMANSLSLLPIVGRTEYIQWLREWLEKPIHPGKNSVGGSIFVRPSEQVQPTCPPLTLLLGEMGSGKTRLAIEASHIAANLGYYQVWITCRALEIATPYFLFREFLGVLLHQLP